jgi:hypothetical protein
VALCCAENTTLSKLHICLIGITKEFTAVEFKTGGLVLLLHRSFKTNKLAANLSIFCPG